MILPRVKRIGYGAAELGVSGAEVMLRVSLLIYYTQIVGMRADLASYAIALGVFWDAMTDPLMGRISDYAYIKGQRRRPFLLPSGIGLSLFLILIFNVPKFESEYAKFFYLLITYLGTNTFLTMLSIPHIAFAGDLSNEPKIRMELFGWRLIFANIGLILGTSIPAIIVLFFTNSHSADSLSSFVMGFIIIMGVVITLISTKGLDKANIKNNKKNYSFNFYLAEFKKVLLNTSFMRLLIAYMVANIGLTINSGLALYYYKFYLQLDEATVRGIIAFFMLIFCLSIPFWIWTARYISKYNIIVANVGLLGIMTMICYPAFPPGVAIWPMLAGLLGGIFVGPIVLMDVAVAEIADIQGVKDNNNDSNLGIYFGFWKMGSKFSRAIAMIFTGHALTWIGILNKENSFQLALLFGPGVGIFLLISAILIFLNIKKEKNE